jgi:hypothetical protein
LKSSAPGGDTADLDPEAVSAASSRHTVWPLSLCSRSFCHHFSRPPVKARSALCPSLSISQGPCAPCVRRGDFCCCTCPPPPPTHTTAIAPHQTQSGTL